MKHHTLRYIPYDITSCGQCRVIIAEKCPPVLHIHQMPSGDEEKVFTHQELGLKETHKLHTVRYDERGLLYLSVSDKAIYSLQAYQVAPSPCIPTFLVHHISKKRPYGRQNLHRVNTDCSCSKYILLSLERI